jgi:hypothetical protein
MADPNAQSGFNWGSLLGAGAGTLVNYLGNNSATGALTGAEQGAINTQTGVQGQLSSIYGTQRGLGTGADTALGAQLGLGGTPNYSAFLNSPGFQGSLALGNQGIERAASANGGLYTPNMLNQLGQYDTTYASQNYNNYINQLLQSAGLGAQGNTGLASGITSTGANISQLQQNQGNARAGGTANSTGIASNLLSKVPWGQVANGIGGMWNSGTGASYFGSDYGTGATGTPDASSTYGGNGDTSGDPSGWAGYNSNPS